MAIKSNTEILNQSNEDKLKDTVWGVRSMDVIIPKYDGEGKQIGATSPNIEAAWNAANHAKLNGKLDSILNIVQQLAAGQGVTIDMDQVADAAERGTAKALAEGSVNVANPVVVDVTVNGKEHSNG